MNQENSSIVHYFQNALQCASTIRFIINPKGLNISPKISLIYLPNYPLGTVWSELINYFNNNLPSLEIKVIDSDKLKIKIKNEHLWGNDYSIESNDLEYVESEFNNFKTHVFQGSKTILTQSIVESGEDIMYSRSLNWAQNLYLECFISYN
jgi:hypothetical protein